MKREHLHEQHLKHSFFCKHCAEPCGSSKYLMRHEGRCQLWLGSLEVQRRTEDAKQSHFGILSTDIRKKGRKDTHLPCQMSAMDIVHRLFERCRDGYHGTLRPSRLLLTVNTNFRRLLARATSEQSYQQYTSSSRLQRSLQLY